MPIKISELTPKGANLENSDLIEISQTTSDGYTSKSITGAEIIASAKEGLQETLVSGINIKTVNSTSLLGSGDVAVQPTLVSGTNIKTVNGNSLLGSGDLIIGGGGLTIGTTAITSGTVGRILFEGTGNVVQESSQLSWNNTTNALTLTNGKTFSAYQSGTVLNDALKITASNDGAILGIQNSNASGFSGIEYLNNSGTLKVFTGFNNNNGTEFRFNNIATNGFIDFLISSTSALKIFTSRNIGISQTTDAGYKLDVNGTARVQSGLTISGQTANNYLTIGTGTGNAFFTWSAYFLGVTGVKFRSENLIGDPSGSATTVRASAAIDSRGYLVTDSIGIGTSTNTINASAIAQIDSTTKGFLPPRMTTTQKNAIVTPASGLVVYDTTLNKLCVRTASAWETITSI